MAGSRGDLLGMDNVLFPDVGSGYAGMVTLNMYPFGIVF